MRIPDLRQVTLLGWAKIFTVASIAMLLIVGYKSWERPAAFILMLSCLSLMLPVLFIRVEEEP